MPCHLWCKQLLTSEPLQYMVRQLWQVEQQVAGLQCLCIVPQQWVFQVLFIIVCNPVGCESNVPCTCASLTLQG
jgi:hypothetical protein